MTEGPGSTGVILIGGMSRRMGRDKLSLKIGGQTILNRVQVAVEAVCAETIFVGQGRLDPEKFSISDLRPDRAGPLAGIEAGLTAASHPLVFVAAGDLPFLNSDLVGDILSRLQTSSAAVPYHSGRPHPLCAAYRRDLLPEVTTALDGGVRAVRQFLNDIGGVDYVENLTAYGDPTVTLMNVNSPEDLARARRIGAEELP